MKRFLVFCFDTFYPHGGWEDFAASYDTLEEAVDHKPDKDNVQVVDSATGTLLHTGGPFYD